MTAIEKWQIVFACLCVAVTFSGFHGTNRNALWDKPPLKMQHVY